MKKISWKQGAAPPRLLNLKMWREDVTSRSHTLESRRVLLISTLFKMPYRVLRCAESAGCRTYVLGSQLARGLKYSRYCNQFFQTDRVINGTFDRELANEINRLVNRLAINLVIAGDAPSTRSLIAIRELLQAPCFPMPELAQFDLLNDKWKFGVLCQSLGIKYPASKLFLNREELRQEITSNRISFPKIAKPLSMDGGMGCVTLEAKTTDRQLSKCFYSPILLQEIIEGQNIAASVFCQQGVIRAFMAHKYRRDTYTTFYDDSIFNDVSKLLQHVKADGVFNFDMRLQPDGQIFFLECNPRFFFFIAMSLLAGINFVSLGLPGGSVGGPLVECGSVTVRFPKATIAALFTPWKLGSKSWEAFKFVLSDPLPYLREELGMESNPGPQCRGAIWT